MEPGDQDVAFGSFRLSFRRRELIGPDGPVALGSRAFDVLAALVRHRDRLISKDELISLVWPRVVVEEGNLAVQISALRKALGRDEALIVTVPGHGYRFGGEVRLEGAPPPAAPPDEAGPSGNLPAEVTPLIGRDGELNQLIALIERARLVTLTGPGGIGKTKLALIAGRALADGVPGGCWLAELAPLSEPALIASTIAAALEVEEQPGRPPSDSLVAALRGRRLVLLLDSCEHLIDGVAALVLRLLKSCAGLRVLATSQEPLGVEGEHVVRLAPLEVPAEAAAVDVASVLAHDAVRLFVERARAADQRFRLTDATAPIVADVCRRLDGNPLAIELAAARVPLLGLEALRGRLADRFALLAGVRRTPLARHRRLRSTIEWSHSLLPPDDRLVLRRLGIFADGFTLDAAQAVAGDDGMPAGAVVEAVAGLLQRSLVTTGPDLARPRHRLSESMRDFAREELVRAGELDPIARRAAAWFQASFEAAARAWEHSPTGAWLAPLVPEAENLRAALEWCFGEAGDPALGRRLAAAAAGFWGETGFYAEGRAWLGRASAGAAAGDEPVVALRLWRGLAVLSRGESEALAAAERAVALARRCGEPLWLGRCLRSLGSVLLARGLYGAAEAAVREALAVLAACPAPKTVGLCLADLCVLRGVAGDYAAARRHSVEALERLRRAGDERAVARHLSHSAEFAHHAGQTAFALELAEQSVAAFRGLNARMLLGVGLGNLAAYALALDEQERGRAAGEEALALALECGDRLGIAVAVEHLALAAALREEPVEAALLHGAAEHHYRSAGAIRQPTEQQGWSRLIALLGAALAPDRLSELMAEGAGYAEGELAALARRTRLRGAA